MPEIRLAVIESGLHERGVFAGESPTFVQPTRGAAIRPERFDIIIVPFHTNQVFLAERRQELESFVDSGGVLLVLGACDIAGSDWIPLCQWTQDFTKETDIVTDLPVSKKVFAGVDSTKFHSHWHAHGALIPLRPEMTEILATGEQERPIMIIVKSNAGGAAIITTLDPDHHSSPMVPGGNKKNTEKHRQNALRLLQNLLALSKDFASSRDSTAVWKVSDARKVFLSHKGVDKPLVRDFTSTLAELGYDPWIDEDMLAAGHELERSLLKGMQESCGALFFITPAFTDVGWLSKEIDYAIAEKNVRGNGFAIVTIVFPDETGKTGAVPELLTRYVYKKANSDLEALREIVRALPVRPGPAVWR